MSESMKPIGAGLGGLFADLERRARETLNLTARVRQAVAEPEKEHVLSASYRDEALVIVMDSAAWAARLRYQLDELGERLRQGGETQVTTIRVRVGAGSD